MAMRYVRRCTECRSGSAQTWAENCATPLVELEHCPVMQYQDTFQSLSLLQLVAGDGRMRQCRGA